MTPDKSPTSEGRCPTCGHMAPEKEENQALRNALNSTILNVERLAEEAERVLRLARQALEAIPSAGEDSP